MTAQTPDSHIVVREHEPLGGLDAADQKDLEHFVLDNLGEDDDRTARPVLALRNGKLYARNHVGVIETKRGTIVEILPKVDLATFDANEHDTRDIFLTMLRAYRGLRFAQFNQANIQALRRFNMLDAFVRLFLDDLALLARRGLARQYRPVEDNLPRLRGRIQFPQHIRLNAANRTRFHVAFDEFTADRPVNRLIRTTIHRLRARAHPDHRQLLRHLSVSFADVPFSERPEADWQRHRIDRSMHHYDTVMAWVGLFLFNHGLATFAGEHVNRALLFPMEDVFEDFVVDSFRRHQREFQVQSQGPQRPFAKIGTRDAFTMKPDIALIRDGKVRFVLDAKWKKIDSADSDPKHGIIQGDIYQLYSYGRRFGCRTVALVYPRTPQFQSPLRYQFNDEVKNQPLALRCFPFDTERPEESVDDIMRELLMDAIDDLKAFQKTHHLGGLSVRQMIEDGRRH